MSPHDPVVQHRENLVNARIKIALILIGGLALLTMSIRHLSHRPAATPRQSSVNFGMFSDVAVARPEGTLRGLSIIFADSRQFAAPELARRIAETGSAVAVIDSAKASRLLSPSNQTCPDGAAIAELIGQLGQWANAEGNEKQIIAGIGDGALLAFLASQDAGNDRTDYLSIDFSAKLPGAISVCPPFAVDKRNHFLQPPPAPPSKGHWRAVWTDQPPNETGIFVRSIPNAETVIAPYDTPLDKVAVDEIANLLGRAGSLAPPMPIVEVPATRPNPVLTLFYSGDGGWRDLDRAVAQEMANAGFPVAGVDVLRYFWERKSPEQAANDLSATMAYYQKTQGSQSFVLAGYSFGADILPAVFNRLPPADQDSIKLLVMLAVAEQASFEIHVSGWLGAQSGELPLAPELSKIPAAKLMCVYGQEEKQHRGCKGLENSAAELLELPGGHHFDQDYPKLAQRIIDAYHRHALK
jgi:type IV secretory pathway VirJ component